MKNKYKSLSEEDLEALLELIKKIDTENKLFNETKNIIQEYKDNKEDNDENLTLIKQ